MNLSDAYVRDPAYRVGRIDALIEQITLLQGLLEETISAQPERAAFAVDAAFTPERLSDDQRVWYDRLIGMFGDALGATNTNYSGVGVRDYAYALAYDQTVYMLGWALEGVGDAAILAEMKRLMDSIDHVRLTNANDLQESYIVSLFSFYTYILHINQHADAAKWRELTLQRVAAKRGGFVGNEGLAQCTINNMLAAWCLWRVTGDAAYMATVNERLDHFRAHFLYDIERGLWYHAYDNAAMTYESPTWWGEKWGAQWATYLRYDIMALLILSRLGCDVLPPALITERVSELYRDNGTIALRLDGTDAINPYNRQTAVGWTKGAAGWVTSSFVLCWMWNDRVKVKSIAAWESVPGHERMPFVPAAMVSKRE